MRKWNETISPAQMHDQFGMYHGIWNPQMDRCWISDDGKYQVTSRLLRCEWGKVEHVAINLIADVGDDTFLSNDGSRDIPWAEKMAIKNELFGEKRLAIEVYPTKKRLVDACDLYHLWVFEKDFELPFGIHPKDKQAKRVNRGYLNFRGVDAKTGQEFSLKQMLEMGNGNSLL